MPVVRSASRHDTNLKTTLDPRYRFNNIPFPRNRRFVGRVKQLDQLQRDFLGQGKAAKVAITGLGGAGKTQVALELAYRVREATPDCLVIWIPAISVEGLEQAYTAIVKELQIPGCGDTKANSKALLQRHLIQESAGRWLLIFDNADDVTMWVSKDSEQRCLIDYLPRSDHGNIVFTTRDRKAAVKLAQQNVVHIVDSDKGLGIELLRSYLIQKELVNDESCAREMLTELASLPLAIVQAAAYINENSIGLLDYLKLLREGEKDVIELLSEDFEDEGRYREARNPVAMTWLISFEEIQNRDSLAAEYLSFMACIEPTNVPQSLLPPGPTLKEATDAIGLLTAYSFVSRIGTASVLNSHRLVHLAMRNWLRRNDKLSKWNAAAVQRLTEVIPYGGYQTRSLWRLYLPHARRVLGKLDDENMEMTIELRFRVASCLEVDGRYKEAEHFCSQVAETRKEVLGEEHPDTLESLTYVADMRSRQGRWMEAEELQRRTVETATTILGEEHPVVLRSSRQLAWIICSQRRWAEAEGLLLTVVETSKRILGDEHPDTLISMHVLASYYWKQGKCVEAEELCRKTLELRSRMFGKEHPYTLASIAGLTTVYYLQTRFAEAEELQTEVLELSSRLFGKEHPETLKEMSNLASTYYAQNRFTEAEELQIEALELLSKVLGEEHLHTLNAMNNLASTYYSQLRYGEAEELETEVLKLRSRMLGEEHPSTLTTMHNLAVTWICLGREEEAVSLMEKCVRLRRSVLGLEQLDTLESSRILARWQSEGMET